jgi:hypothetical protein
MVCPYMTDIYRIVCAVDGQSNPGDVLSMPKTRTFYRITADNVRVFLCLDHAYSLHIPCIIGISYRIWHGYRNRLLKWAVSMRERMLLCIDTTMSSKIA